MRYGVAQVRPHPLCAGEVGQDEFQVLDPAEHRRAYVSEIVDEKSPRPGRLPTGTGREEGLKPRARRGTAARCFAWSSAEFPNCQPKRCLRPLGITRPFRGEAFGPKDIWRDR